MGSLVTLAPVFASTGLPVEGIGILIALNLVPDIFETVMNVTGDMSAAVVLSRQHGARSEVRLDTI
jgi:proton glutamate symport protein